MNKESNITMDGRGSKDLPAAALLDLLLGHRCSCSAWTAEEPLRFAERFELVPVVDTREE